MTRMTKKAICVYCGASDQVDPKYLKAAYSFGQALAVADLGLVYGGGSLGLMGQVAKGAMSSGGSVLGIIPEFLHEREAAATSITELRVVPDMHSRKAAMFEAADGFAVLPGGIGTLEELFEMATWRQLGRHRKPIVALSIDGFWDPAKTMIETMAARGFVHGDHRDLMFWSSSVEEAVTLLKSDLS